MTARLLIGVLLVLGPAGSALAQDCAPATIFQLQSQGLPSAEIARRCGQGAAVPTGTPVGTACVTSAGACPAYGARGAPCQCQTPQGVFRGTLQ